ncbi:hypothetical protein [Kineothrix sedimenti]|uniref:Uncharacterized protein n=1 Tax=Kineothrix sedimenti TaxID=3123317 RepID=A0ABZ3F3B8_9FIRM
MNFEMTGKIGLSKETEKFKPYLETTYDSGWVKRKIMFNVVCGDNRHLLTVDAGSFADGHGDIYTFSKGSIDGSGNKVKGESLKIPFKDRLTSKKLAEVAEFKKFIFDLEKPGRRYKLEKAAEKIKEGTSLTDDELKEVGLENESEVVEALEKSKKKHHEFISEWDFAEFIKKVIESGKYKDSKFFIRGNSNYQYSDKKQQVYESYVPQRIYLAAEDAEESSTATIKIIYNAESLDSMSVEEKGKYYVNGYMMEYDNNRKSNIPVPITITIPVAAKDSSEKDKKFVEGIKRKFTVEDDTYKELGVEVKMLNGAQKVEITDDMLTDEQKEDLDCGLITLDDIRSELGGSVYGDRIQEYQFLKIARGFTKGRNETVYTDDDMVIRPIEEELSEGTEDLFEDEDIADNDDDL